MTKSEKLLLLDGNSLVFRAFYAMYTSIDRYTNSEGLHTNAIFTFNNMLAKLLELEEPDRIMVAFDAGRTTFRTAWFEDYKGQRDKTPSELVEQLGPIRTLLDHLGIPHYQLENYEADDIIGTLAKQGEAAGMQVTIVTGDRDLTQLTTDAVTVKVTVKGVGEIEAYTPAHVQEKLGVSPRQIIDLKGLMGDTSDNYPGVTKVGEKTALKLITQFGSIENLYDHIDDLKASKMKENLINDEENARLSKRLATIKQDAPLTISLADTVYGEGDREALIAFYQQMDMKQALAKLMKDQAQTQQKPISYTVLDQTNIDALKQLNGPITFELEMLEGNYHVADMVGAFIGDADHTFVTTDVSLLTIPAVADWLAEQQLIVFDAKRNIVAANRLGLTLGPISMDLLLASYLLNPDENSDDLGTVALDHDYMDLPTDEAVYGKGKKRAVPEDDVFFSHLASKSQALLVLAPDLTKDLKEQEETKLFEEIELPLAKVLAGMEMQGITLDVPTLKKMGAEWQQSMAVLEEKIYAEAGLKFNLKSTKQLGEVLFEKLGLPVIKKTKTGYSTDAEVLDQLKGSHPIVADILAYRTVAKLDSTYVKGLLTALLPDGKIHTRYLQTLTQTGRLSSVDPNMQNIPARDTGRQVRQAFVPSHPGWQIFSSDYSQIELRVLAHISGDKNMQEAFKEDRDIHANTAMRIFNLDSADQVTPDMRRQAKATNFGIVYGISDFGLSRNIGITRVQAKRFIDSYFEQYPEVKAYMEKMVKVAKEQGYVETLFNRRRYLPDIHAKNFNLRSFAERTAMNTPIQGSAADIIKVAMIQVQAALREAGLQSRMLLQVHDELIFEGPEEEMATLAQLVPSVMDAAVKLAVPLKVESHVGATWFDAK